MMKSYQNKEKEEKTNTIAPHSGDIFLTVCLIFTKLNYLLLLTSYFGVMCTAFPRKNDGWCESGTQ